MSTYSLIFGGVTIAAAIIFSTIIIFRKMGTATSLLAKKDNQIKLSKKNRASLVKSTRDKIQDFPAGKLVVYFGSQTGTAESLSKTIVDDAKKRGFDAKLIDLEDFDESRLPTDRIAIFLTATYGEGDPTDNAKNFHKWLKNVDNTVPSTYLNELTYCVFGLGNKQYINFNGMGKFVDIQMESLGAKRVIPIGLGDDDASMEEDFEKWRELLWTELTSLYLPKADPSRNSVPSAKSNVSCGIIDKVNLTFTAVACDAPLPTVVKEIPASEINKSTKYFFDKRRLPVTVNRELRQSTVAGSTRHIELDLSGSGLSYITADNIAVIPENDPTAVLALCQQLGYEPDSYFEIFPCPVVTVDGQEDRSARGGFKHTFPTPCTIREAFTLYLDFSGVPSLASLESLLPYLEDKKHRALLEDLLFSDVENSRDYLRKYLKAKGRSLFAMLSAGGELASCRIPLSDLLHIVPPIQPRYYTISSSSSLYPTSVHITVRLTQTMVEELTVLDDKDVKEYPRTKAIGGLCSNYFKRLTVNDSCRAYFRSSSFRLPTNTTTPVIMIGPGTGLAPMRALLQERKYMMSQQLSSSSSSSSTASSLLAAATLYFGCQNSEQDYIYK